MLHPTERPACACWPTRQETHRIPETGATYRITYCPSCGATVDARVVV